MQIERHSRTSHRSPAAVLAGIALCLAASAAAAQAVSYKMHCHDVGVGPPEPLGDREGHAVSVSNFTCTYEGGPWDGGVTTGSNIWEWDQVNATLLSGGGVARKPGVTNAWQTTDGKLALTFASDGKTPTGWTGSGKGTVRMATGSTAKYLGKPFSWTAAATGPGRFQIEVRHP